MRMDFDWLRACDVLLRLPGESSGADREAALAREFGIAVFEGFSTGFWDHLNSGIVAVEQRAVFTDAELALERLRGALSATMTVDGQGDYVVSWRPV
jgi:hypothetical protein